jgi:hypothetical protein
MDEIEHMGERKHVPQVDDIRQKDGIGHTQTMKWDYPLDE